MVGWKLEVGSWRGWGWGLVAGGVPEAVGCVAGEGAGGRGGATGGHGVGWGDVGEDIAGELDGGGVALGVAVVAVEGGDVLCALDDGAVHGGGRVEGWEGSEESWR